MFTTGIRLSRKIFVLGMLVACLVVFSDNYTQDAQASSACCEECDPAWTECRMECYDTYAAGTQRSQCLGTCGQQRNNCLSHCEFCESGGSGMYVGEGAG